ncbi:DegT/DnrJ/EryC1/StrS family aminotransferase [Maribacter sp. CXY002]|uniref:DegT/DnrJ/EryC1/StrS family aminotransferase n=1 Tax=Maribacter luteocoastalis TaxID=3407671 RepID=UPI003B66B620
MSKNNKIYLSPPHLGSNEQKYVAEAFATNWIAPLGPNVTLFEESLSSYVGNDAQVAMLSSGTAGLHLALKILDVGLGDEVICQSFTFSASANPILYLRATPVFVDSEKDTWNMCPTLLEKAIESRIKEGKKPKAIVAVHLYGMPYKANEINGIAQKYGIPVVEDSAEALGSTYNGQKCGNLAHIGIVSFNGNKIITTSGGGALLSKDKDIKEKAVFLATQARDDAPHYQHSHVGYNYRMSNVLAGIGRGQLEVLDDRVAARRANFDFYKNHLDQFEQISFLEEPKGFYSNRWLTTMVTGSYKQREQLRLAMLEEEIESRPLWKPLHEQPIFKKYPNQLNGVSSTLFEKGLCLPSGSSLTDDDRSRILEVIVNVLKND